MRSGRKREKREKGYEVGERVRKGRKGEIMRATLVL